MESVLVYIKLVNKISDSYEYDFFFSDTPDYVWGNDWDVYNPSSCEDTSPDETTYNSVYKVTTTLPLKTAQETSCMSLEYATYRMLALGWIDIENLQEYPQNGRMVFYFGDTMERVEELLSKYEFSIEKRK